jgi:cytochrome b561
MGLILACLLVLRIAWRLTGGIRLPQSDPGVSGKMAIGAHLLLYALLLVVVLLGLACVWTRGDTLLHQFAVPVFDPGNRRLAESTVGLHGLAANLLGIVAASHASTAVLHHWLLKDGVLRRMWPGRRRDRS